MITRDTQVVGVGPDLTEDEFIAIVVPKSKLTTLDAQLAYRAIIAAMVSPAFCLAVFWHESNFGRLGICHDYNTKSPGNTRSSVTHVVEEVPTSKGTYIRYPSWAEGFRDLAVRLSVPNYIYGRKHLVTIAQIMPVFAPILDNNDPEIYINKVVQMMNGWLEQSVDMPAGGGGGSTAAMEIIDLSGSTPSSVYTERGFSVSELILHDTSGGGDYNNKSEAELQALLNATIRWFQGNGGVSIHYLVGPEKLGGKIYRLCKEQFAAYHAVGNKGLSTVNGFTISKDNRIAIGIERFGQPNDTVGPNQRAAMLWLVVDICKRYGLSAGQVISHASIQSDRTDGRVLLQAARDAVTNGGTIVSPDFDPIMKYVDDNGGEAVFGKPLGGLYGTNGSVERDFTFAHLYLDKTSGKVVPEMKDRTNPLGKKVGAGIYGKAKENGLMLITNEQWFSPDPGQPGLGKMSRAWAQDSKGVTVVLMASEEPELAKPGQDTPWKVEVLEVM
jgi:hypothetical protein